MSRASGQEAKGKKRTRNNYKSKKTTKWHKCISINSTLKEVRQRTQERTFLTLKDRKLLKRENLSLGQ